MTPNPAMHAWVQVFSLIAMEPPIRVSGAGSADYVRDAKVMIAVARYNTIRRPREKLLSR